MPRLINNTGKYFTVYDSRRENTAAFDTTVLDKAASFYKTWWNSVVFFRYMTWEIMPFVKICENLLMKNGYFLVWFHASEMLFLAFHVVVSLFLMLCSVLLLYCSWAGCVFCPGFDLKDAKQENTHRGGFLLRARTLEVRFMSSLIMNCSRWKCC